MCSSTDAFNVAVETGRAAAGATGGGDGGGHTAVRRPAPDAHVPLLRAPRRGGARVTWPRGPQGMASVQSVAAHVDQVQQTLNIVRIGAGRISLLRHLQ